MPGTETKRGVSEARVKPGFHMLPPYLRRSHRLQVIRVWKRSANLRWIADVLKLAWKANRTGKVLGYGKSSSCYVIRCVCRYPRDVLSPTIVYSRRLACKFEINLTSQASRRSILKTECDSVTNVHICLSGVPGHVPGMLAAYENGGL